MTPKEIRAEAYNYIKSLGFNMYGKQQEELSKILKNLSSGEKEEKKEKQQTDKQICISCQMKIEDDIIQPDQEGYE